ncbi:MAG: hypothetical protein SPJ57_02930 [Candidatus Methanomethylophilaceae archaeon]|nr:hypothetical protein [Candidatus Methanomethylophilaceae archaeon]
MKKVRDRFDVDRSMLIEDGDISVGDDGIKHHHLFCAAFLDELVDPEYVKMIERDGVRIDIDDDQSKRSFSSDDRA